MEEGRNKAELFRFGDRALLFLFANFFPSPSETEGPTSAPFLLGRAERNLSKFFLFQSETEGSTSFSLRFRPKENSPARVPLVDEVTDSGFFYLPKFLATPTAWKANLSPESERFSENCFLWKSQRSPSGCQSRG